MKAKENIKANWPVMVFLILGLSTIIFPLYMTIVIGYDNDHQRHSFPAESLES